MNLRRLPYHIFCTLLLCVLGGQLSAQSRYGSVAGIIFSKNSDINGSESALSGVNITIYTQKDTVSTTTVQSEFYLSKLTPGRAEIRFSYVGYKTVTRRFEIKAGETTQFYITMEEEAQQIGAVKVKGSVPLYTVKEDTVIFNAAAVKTLEGDETIEILRQMPGVLLSDQKVNVMGQDVARTYIDGKLIFGHDPMAALNNLLAADVIKIRAYDERADKSRNGNPNDIVRVLNIETRSKLVAATVGHFLASYGHDIPAEGDKGRRRYGVGATANFFSEKLLLSANVFTNNVNRTSNRVSDLLERPRDGAGYNRNTYAEFGFERDWAGEDYVGPSMSANYSYGDDYSKTENIYRRTYFPAPAEGYESRIVSDTSRSTRRGKTHRSSLSFGWSTARMGGFSLSHNYNYTDKNNRTYGSYRSVTDGGTPQGTRSLADSKYGEHFLSEQFGWGKFYKNKFHISLTADMTLQKGDGSGIKYDSLLSTNSVSVLSTSPLNTSKDFKIKAFFDYLIEREKGHYIQFFYDYRYQNELKKQLAFNTLDGIFQGSDKINTFDYTTDNQTHTGTFVYRKLIKKINLGLTLSGVTTAIGRAERIPRQPAYTDRFSALLPQISILNTNIASNFTLMYSTMAIVPFVEQLRPLLDNNNLYNLRAGNPHLKQSYRHSLLGLSNHLFGKSGGSLAIQTEATYTKNYIAAATRYFSQDTPLPQYDGYVAPAGSSLTTYGNLDGYWTAAFDATYRTPLKGLGCNLTVGPKFSFENAPSFREEQVIRSSVYAPALSVGLTSNFSRTVRLSVSSATGYTFTENNIGDSDKYLRESVSASATVNNLFKRLVLNATYNGIFYRRISDSQTDNSHVLNLSLGCKILKRMGEVNVAVFDVLNSTSSFSTKMNADYIENSWRQSFGRYFTVNFAFKFNKTKPGVAYEGNMNDGGIKLDRTSLLK